VHYWVPGDLSTPPNPKTVKRRIPDERPVWSSNSYEKQEAVWGFVERWERVTGTPRGRVCRTCGNTKTNAAGRPCLCMGKNGGG